MLAALTSSELKMLDSIQESIANENVSYDEIVWFQSHRDEVKVFGNELLAEWAGISEDEFWDAQIKMANA